MPTPPQNHDARAALRALTRRDAQLGRLIKRIGPYTPEISRNPFLTLIGSIIHQQVSMAAAATIHRRLRELCPRKRITPAAILALDVPTIRSAGLSARKAEYARGVATAFASGELSAPKLRRMSDEEVIAILTQLKGIGRWTTEMLLIFCLERPDIWPVDDLGLRKAAQLHVGAAEPLPTAELTELGERWRPHRSIATWYLWRSLDNPIKPRVTH